MKDFFRKHNIAISNSFWSALGTIAPFLFIIISYAVLARNVNAYSVNDIFLVCMLINVFSVSDFGVGRVTCTRLIESMADYQNVIKKGMYALVFFSFLASVIYYVLMLGFLDFDNVFSLNVIFICWISIIITGIRITLESLVSFKSLFFYKFSNTISTYVVPAALSFFTESQLVFFVVVLILKVIILSKLVESRLSGLVKLRPVDWHFFILAYKDYFPYFKSTSISTFASIALSYLDRIIISKFGSPIDVSKYLSVADVASRGGVLVGSIVQGVYKNITESTKAIDQRWHLAIFIFYFCVSLVLMFFGDALVVLWLGDSFSSSPFSHIMIILLFSSYLNSVAQLSYYSLISLYKQNIIARLHMVELFIFVPLLYIMSSNYSILGASLTLFFRNLFDYLVLRWLECRAKTLVI